jgi:hypothetical protein
MQARPIVMRSCSVRASTITNVSSRVAASQSAARGCGRRRNYRPRYEPHRCLTLAREPTSDVGIRHWVERMLLKPGLTQKTITNEEVSTINRSTDRGKSRASNHTLCAEGGR